MDTAVPSPPPTPSPAVRAFAAELGAARGDVAAFALAGGADGNAAKKLEQLRAHAAAELDALEAEVLALPDGSDRDRMAAEDTRQAWRIVGRHAELVQQLDRQPFTIIPEEVDGYVADLQIQTRDVPIPADAGVLKSEIDAAANVIRTVMAERLRTLPRFFAGARKKAVLSAQDEYMRQLLGVARVGLETTEPSRVAFARLDLLRLTNLFTLREAGVVKNAYVNRLAFWSALAALVFAALYGLARSRAWCPAAWPGACEALYDLRNFHLLAVGTAVGTWLSFSLRRQDLAFADLALLEPDRLWPGARVVFMIGLSTLVGLLLFSGAVVAGVGSVTGFEGMHAHGSWALLFGLLAGVAERALGTAVTKRGLDFAAAVGGAVAPAATAKV